MTFSEICSALKKKPISVPIQTENGKNVIKVWSSGHQILSKNKMAIAIIASLFESDGYGDLIVGYYDPKEDARLGLTDEFTGHYFVENPH